MRPERVLFVTGRLAESVVKETVARVADQANIRPSVRVLGISVAALMHVDWITRKLTIDEPIDRVMLPGWCQGDLATLESRFGVPFELGPKDIRDLPRHLSLDDASQPDLTDDTIEILAEINHAPRMSVAEICRAAEHYRTSGADIIDLGCIPGESWAGVGEAVSSLCRNGFRVSIDSFDRPEVEAAVAAGAELVLSCNSSNIDWAAPLEAELVAIPDDPADLATLWTVCDRLEAAGARYRVDPILEPIGFGFAASLARYYDVRRLRPDVPMMMGIGNVTELVEVDSAGVNLLLAALCEELEIHSVLTTEVINWSRSAVKEFDVARRLVHYSLTEKKLPKHVGAGLVMLRDERVHELGPEALEQLANRLTDPNFRIFAEGGRLHVMNRSGYWTGRDAFEVITQVLAACPDVDASHAFYLGYELSKATTALTLGKHYVQDEALNWGILTQAEPVRRSHRLRDAATQSQPDAERRSGD